MNSKYCRECGSKLLPEVKFCSNCGKQVNQTHNELGTVSKVTSGSSSNPTNMKMLKNKKILLGLGILVVVVIALLVWKGNGNPEDTANSFIDYCSAGEYEKAYELFDQDTREFYAAKDRSQNENWDAEYYYSHDMMNLVRRINYKLDSYKLINKVQNGDTTILKYNFTYKSKNEWDNPPKELEVVFSMVKEDGKWKVDTYED